MTTWEESFAEADLPPEKRAKTQEGVDFVRELGVRCTGSSVRETCDWPPLQVILFHGRALGVCCVECTHVNGAMIIGMGHGAFTSEGVLAFKKAGTGDRLKLLSDTILKDPLREVSKGRYWKASQEKAWRKSLAEYKEANA